MHPQRRPSRPRARSWLPGLLALAAASCEADRYPVGAAAAGREVDDAAELAKVTAAFRASRLSLREILVVVVQSRPFVEP